jgi:hypothetical protein
VCALRIVKKEEHIISKQNGSRSTE